MMTLKKTRLKTIAAAVLSGLLLSTQASALTFTNTGAVRYGDFLAWDLPVLGFNVQSSPGQIDPYVVLYTGAGGTHLDNTDTLGIAPNGDNSYEAPSGHTPNYFSTSIKPTFPDPVQAFTGDTQNTWDVRLSALSSFLNGSDAIFYFNNNQTGNTQIEISLWAWGQVKLVDDAGVLPTLTFDFRNYFTNNGTVVDPILGGQTSLDPTLYTSNGTNVGVDQADVFSLPGNVDSNQYYPFIPGEVCFDSGGLLVLCDDPTAVPGSNVKLNLGANDAAYALTSPEINALLHSPNFGGYDVMQVEFRLAGLDNGYEQLFIKGGDTFNPPQVPEPATMLLLGVGLAGLAGYRLRRHA